MPNIAGYSETSDPAWIQVQFDDGSSQHVQDPTGTYRREVDEVASKLGFKRPDPMAGAVAGPGGGDMLAGNSLAMPATAPISPTEAAPMQVSAADRAVLEGKAPVPAPSMVSPAEQRALAPNPADLAGLRRGLGETSHAGGGSIEGVTLEGNRLAMPAPSLGQPLAGNQLAMPAPGDAPPLPSPTAPVLDLNALPPVDRGGLRQSLAAQESAHQNELMAAQSQQDAAAERARQAAVAASREGTAQGPTMFMAPGTGPQTTTESSRSSSGLTGADRAKVDAANLGAIDANERARQAQTEAQTQQVNAEWGRLTLEQKQKLAEKALLDQQEAAFNQRIKDNHQRLEADLSRKVDPGQAFKGDAEAYAFMAGLGDSLQNFGAALAGRGPVANPGETINRIINRSVQQQTEQKEQDFRRGQITADQLLADRQTIRARQLTVGQQLTDNMLSKERNQARRAELQGASKFIASEKAAAIAAAAAATARHETLTESRQTAPGTPGAVTMFNGEKPDWNAVEAHSQRQAGAEQVERGVGRLEKAAGWTWDEKANNGAGGYIGKDGKVVSEDSADVSGTSVFGATPSFLAGEMGRETKGALDDMAAGGAKIKDPVGAVSDKSIDAERDAMAAGTDQGVLRAAIRTRRNLRSMKAGIDAAYSPGVVNASRLRRNQETQFQTSQPGLPPSRAPRPGEL